MSATNRGTIRREADFYPTPEYCVKLLVGELRTVAEGLKWGEPCKGDGSIIKATGYPYWQYAELSEGKDYFDQWFTDVNGIITNPPFALAQEFIDKSLVEADFVAYLLRLNFFGSRKRREWWQGKKPTHLFTLSERPVFVYVCKGIPKLKQKGCGKTYPIGYNEKCECGGNVSAGTDATEYAWFVWDKLDLCIRPPGMYVI